MKTGLRTNGAPCHIIFTQGLQGSGKSTVSAAVAKKIKGEYIEQDMNRNTWRHPIQKKVESIVPLALGNLNKSRVNFKLVVVTFSDQPSAQG